MKNLSGNGFNQGENLIFIITRPRSGSTLLQHILGSHSEIYTLPEPWIMLPLVFMGRPSGSVAEYDAFLAYYAQEHFLKQIPEGKAVYEKAVRDMALSLYGKALEQSKKKYFLDKSGRYYFIICDLYKLFPAAKFVFLIRNPLAILSSKIEGHLEGKVTKISEREHWHDLVTAPYLMLDGIKELGEKAAVVYYEKLVTSPEATIKTLCDQLNVCTA